MSSKPSETEKGHFLRISFKDWFTTDEAKEVLRTAGKTGLPTFHITGNPLNRKSGIVIPFDDGDSEYKRIFNDSTWFLICARAGKNHFNHGLIWLTNE
jgi:hypothetical protein